MVGNYRTIAQLVVSQVALGSTSLVGWLVGLWGKIISDASNHLTQ
jgi:hypothetical protein